MKCYSEYDDNGNITTQGFCPDENFEDVKKRNGNVIEGVPDPAIYKIVDRKIVKKTEQEIQKTIKKLPEPLQYDQQRAEITNGQLQNILNRLDALEGE